MGLLSKFESKMDDGIQGAAGMMGRSSISPIQITKKAEKQMRREKIVGAGKQYAPTLYTVLVSPQDNENLFKFYPTLAGETETYLMARAREEGYAMDGHPLVRFLVDPELKKGKFDVVAEVVAARIIARLREDEMKRYGLPTKAGTVLQSANTGAAVQHGAVQPAYSQPGFSHQEAVQDSAVQPVNAPGYDASADDAFQASQPAARNPQKLQVYLYDEARDTAYNLTGAIQTIGRESSNDIVVPDMNISRVHAQICREPDGTWTVTDLNSTNGMYVNGRKTKSMPLRDADMITIGTSTLEFQNLE